MTRSEKWHVEVPDGLQKSDNGLVEVWWDQTVATPTKFEANRPDMVIVDRRKKEWFVVDFSVPFDPNVAKKEEEKRSKYRELATEVARMNAVRVEVVPIVVGWVVSWLKMLGWEMF